MPRLRRPTSRTRTEFPGIDIRALRGACHGALIRAAVIVVALAGLVSSARALEHEVRLDEADVAWPTDAGVPPTVRSTLRVAIDSSEADYLQASIYYDPSRLEFTGVTLADAARLAGWALSEEDGFREVEEGVLRGIFVRDADRAEVSPTPGRSIPVAEMEFRLARRADEDTFYEEFGLDFLPVAFEEVGGSADTFVGRLEDDGPVAEPTKTAGASISVYYASFVEVGSGEITRREQVFSVPLRVTYLGDGEILFIGIDYDELILNSVEPGLIPRTIRSRIDEAEKSAELELELDRDSESPRHLLREPVAELVFRYEDGAEAEAQPQRVLRILPVMADARGEGAAEAVVTHSVPGLIELGSPRFVRGNVDSSVRANGRLEADATRFAPDLSDAIILLEILFSGGGDREFCREAADTNDDGTVALEDAVLLLGYLFRGGVEPASPFPTLGEDTAAGVDLGCERPLPHFSPRDSGL